MVENMYSGSIADNLWIKRVGGKAEKPVRITEEVPSLWQLNEDLYTMETLLMYGTAGCWGRLSTSIIIKFYHMHWNSHNRPALLFSENVGVFVVLIEFSSLVVVITPAMPIVYMNYN